MSAKIGELTFLKELAGRFDRIEVRKEVGAAIHLARSMAQAEDAILIAGSIFTAAEALRALEAEIA